MTDSHRKGWLGGLGVAGIASILGLLAYWPQAQPLADWLIFNVGAILARPQVEAVILGMLAGSAVILGLPWMLPNTYCGETTRTRLRIYACGLAFAVSFALMPTRLGFVYAALTGLAGTQVGMSILRLLQKFLPSRAVPQSLKPSHDGP